MSHTKPPRPRLTHPDPYTPVRTFQIDLRNDTVEEVPVEQSPDERIAALESENATLKESSPGDIRTKGWMVAVHNDYRQNGENHTFWLFTRGDRCAKGEGKTDAEALNQVRLKIAKQETHDA
jgi:hypothetical protein